MTDLSMAKTAPSRVVAIVGRPNVGKSALFNRIARRRIAIVHEESGVTRDRLSVEATWQEERFDLIDTGGLAIMDNAQAPDEIDRGIRRQVDVAVQDASVVVLVTDVTAGRLPLDTEVSRLLRQSGRTVLIAANKADHPAAARQAVEFSGWGYPVFPVSALHNIGIGDLLDAVVEQLPPAAPSAPGEALRVAVVGRPNVGKSSYVNRLLRDERVLVSSQPGTTRDSVEIPFTIGRGDSARTYRFIDTAGVRRLGKLDSAVERFSMFRTDGSIERADVVVMMLDATQGPGRQDKRIARKILDDFRGCLLLVNKWDLALAAKITQRQYASALREALPFLGFVPIVFVSAQSGYNLRRSVDAIDYVAGQVRTELSTGVLNRVLQDAFQRVQPPVVGGRRLKLYYATQTGASPVRISLFVNDRQRLTAAYRAYLIHALRSAFGLEGAPISLRFRNRREDREG